MFVCMDVTLKLYTLPCFGGT